MSGQFFAVLPRNNGHGQSSLLLVPWSSHVNTLLLLPRNGYGPVLHCCNSQGMAMSTVQSILCCGSQGTAHAVKPLRWVPWNCFLCCCSHEPYEIYSQLRNGMFLSEKRRDCHWQFFALPTKKGSKMSILYCCFHESIINLLQIVLGKVPSPSVKYQDLYSKGGGGGWQYSRFSNT